MTVGTTSADTRADRHREKRAKHAAEAQFSPSQYGLDRRTRRKLARDFAHTLAPSSAGILAPKPNTNRTAPKRQRRARAKAY